jgi:phospholipid/cholesterol/gamma-HCH transport system substrate-binding protein
MYEKINYTAVGIFVLLFSAISLYFAFWLAKGSVNKENFNIYYTYFNESVDGLSNDSVVKLNGVDVGRLENLSIDKLNHSKIVATLYINKDIKITEDMYTILKSQGLTGLRYINIIGGVSKNIIEPNLKESVIKSRASFVSKLMLDTPALVSKLTKFSESLNSALSSKNIENINKILDNSKVITNKTIELEDNLNSFLNNNNKAKITALIDDINSTLIEYKKVAKNANLTLNTVNKKLPSLLSSLKISANKLSKTSNLIEKTIKRGDYNLKRILRPAIVDLKELSISYIELSNELKSLVQSPSDALFNGVSLKKGPGE